jgi:hypothetical protein
VEGFLALACANVVYNDSTCKRHPKLAFHSNYAIIPKWLGVLYIGNFLLMWACKYGFNVCRLCKSRLGCSGQDP